MSTPKPIKNVKLTLNNEAKIIKFQKRLKLAWLIWLGYRGLAFPMLITTFLATQPNLVGGIAWQFMWLIPALLFTPWILKGSSPYALLLGSIITLIYFGASGVNLFSRFYDNGISVWWVYLLDTILLGLVNVWLFKLLKFLPSMNKSN